MIIRADDGAEIRTIVSGYCEVEQRWQGDNGSPSYVSRSATSGDGRKKWFITFDIHG